MKNLILKVSSVFILAIILTVVSVQAQSFRQYKAQIPFDFNVGNKTYQAGDYKISLYNPSGLCAILKLENTETRDFIQLNVLTNGSRSRMNKTSLMFDQYGDQYSLSEVVSDDYGVSVTKTKAQKWLSKKLSQQSKTMAIALINK